MQKKGCTLPLKRCFLRSLPLKRGSHSGEALLHGIRRHTAGAGHFVFLFQCLQQKYSLVNRFYNSIQKRNSYIFCSVKQSCRRALVVGSSDLFFCGENPFEPNWSGSSVLSPTVLCSGAAVTKGILHPVMGGATRRLTRGIFTYLCIGLYWLPMGLLRPTAAVNQA